MAVKHELPSFLEGKVEPEKYSRWLSGRAAAHAKRDAIRGLRGVTVANYRELIHQAVGLSEGRDFYTGQMLDWHRLGTYENAASKLGRHSYKKSFDLMPSIDHEDAAATVASFRICGWAVNDAKHALSTADFIELSRKVLVHAGWKVEMP